MKENFNTGKRLHELRVQRGLSQEQLALQADITPTYLGQIERNIKNPTINTIEKICTSINVSLAEFFSTSTETHEIDALSMQIISQVSNRTADEKRLILNILKQILRLSDLEK